jgi:hypothetical protein
MPNDSSTGGYLSPTSTGGDRNDQALNRFLQQVVVGIVGLPGNMVFPRWQDEPPNVPDHGVNWASIGRSSRKRDGFSATIHNPNDNEGNGSSTVVRNQIIQVLCSFYGPNAEANSELLAMGLEVRQNREVMQLAGYNLIGGAGDSVIAPAKIKNRWTYRVDIPFAVRAQQKYTYPVLNVENVQVTTVADDGSTESVNTGSFTLEGFGVEGYGENPYGSS